MKRKNLSGLLLTLEILPIQVKVETGRQESGLHLKTGHINVQDKEREKQQKRETRANHEVKETDGKTVSNITH